MPLKVGPVEIAIIVFVIAIVGGLVAGAIVRGKKDKPPPSLPG